MRLLSIFLFIFLISSVSATDYYVEIQDGVGAGTGDTNEYFDLPNETISLQQTNNSKKPNNSVAFGDKVIIEKHLFVVAQNDLILVNEKINVTDTAIDPIDWGPIIFWSLILGSILLIIGIGVYFYQIFYY